MRGLEVGIIPPQRSRLHIVKPFGIAKFRDHVQNGLVAVIFVLKDRFHFFSSFPFMMFKNGKNN